MTTGLDTLDPACLAANAALVAGDHGAMAAHAATCAACKFLVSLVPDLKATLSGPGVGRAFEDVLDRAIATGEPLLARYKIEKTIARGGQGIVCKATDRELGTVALKIVRCNPASRDGRLPEGRLAARLTGDGVCRIFNIERHGDIRLITMELIEGECLEDALPRLSSEQRLDIFRRIAEVVGKIHRQGIVHLDLKPRNIVLRTGDDPVVTDFGVAVELEDDGAATPIGHTPEFAPPEQLAGGRVDRRADVHALGVTLERMAVSPSVHLRRVVARACSERPADRYADAAALLADLDRPLRRRGTIVRASVVGAAGLGIAGVAAFYGLPSSSAPPAELPATTLDFDRVPTYGKPKEFVDADTYLRAAGIRFEVSPMTRLVIGNTLAFYEGKSLVPASPPNSFTQTWLDPVSGLKLPPRRRGDPNPVSFTLTFPKPVVLVTFKRPALIPATESGITFPQWNAITLDAGGRALLRFGEAAFGSYHHVPARPVALYGGCIAALRVESDNYNFAAFIALVLDDLTYVEAADGAC